MAGGGGVAHNAEWEDEATGGREEAAEATGEASVIKSKAAGSESGRCAKRYSPREAAAPPTRNPTQKHREKETRNTHVMLPSAHNKQINSSNGSN